MIMALLLLILNDMHANDSSSLNASTLVVLELLGCNLLLEHLVDLLKSPVLGLGDKEEHKDEDDDI